MEEKRKKKKKGIVKLADEKSETEKKMGKLKERRRRKINTMEVRDRRMC